jgi:hypothetical protein
MKCCFVEDDSDAADSLQQSRDGWFAVDKSWKRLCRTQLL